MKWGVKWGRVWQGKCGVERGVEGGMEIGAESGVEVESRVRKAEWKVRAKWLEELTGALSLECGERSGGETGKREAVIVE